MFCFFLSHKCTEITHWTVAWDALRISRGLRELDGGVAVFVESIRVYCVLELLSGCGRDFSMVVFPVS